MMSDVALTIHLPSAAMAVLAAEAEAEGVSPDALAAIRLIGEHIGALDTDLVEEVLASAWAADAGMFASDATIEAQFGRMGAKAP